MKRFIITGLSRSGTLYMAELFRAIGINCTHEKAFNHKKSDPRWRKGVIDGEASWLAAPFINKLYNGTVVFHQYREPISQIRSRIRTTWQLPAHEYRLFAEKHQQPETKYVDKNLKVMVAYYAEHYYRWNKLIEEQTLSKPSLIYSIYKIEDVKFDLVKKMLGLIEYKCSDESIINALKTVSTTTNTRGNKMWDKRKYINWGSIKLNSHYFARLKEMAINIGYEVPQI